ncbi:O-antigen translocase [Flavobacteriaceae sp. LMIT009]
MDTSKRSYRQILKTTSLFSGVQIAGVLISIAKSKLAAILIGPAGVGIVGVLNSTLNVISGITKFGLDVSAVKEIAFFKDKDEQKVERIILALRRITWLTGLLGSVVTIALSYWLSELVFGNSDYTYSFILISVAILFNQLTTGNTAILQGLRHLKDLAKSAVWASFTSLLVIIPCYYYLGLDGIVPVIILTSILTFLFSWYFSKKVKANRPKITCKDSLNDSKEMMKLGIVLSLGGFATILTTYAIQIFLTNKAGIDEVGFYNAAFIIVNAYVGVIFIAMSKDYFPRLSAIADESEKMNQTVNQQALIAILLLSPIIIVFIAFAPFLIELLFSKEFLPILGIVTFAILATIFKAVSWCLGYIIVAKGDSKLFIITEVIFNLLLFVMSIIGYLYGGLKGIGISYLIYYIIYLIGVKIIASNKYQFQFNKELYRVFSICILFCGLAFTATLVDNVTLRYVFLIVMILLSSIFTLVQLNSKTEFISGFKDRE